MAAVGYHCHCCSVSAECALNSGSAPSTSGIFLAPSLTGHQRLPIGKKKAALRKRLVLRGLRVQSRAGIGRGSVKLKDEVVKDESEPDFGSGTKKFQKLPGTLKLQGTGRAQPKDNKLVFVAGASGRVGSRTVRELLKLGFRVRAGTRDVEKAESLLEDVLQNSPEDEEKKPSTPFANFLPAKLFGFLSPTQGKKVEIVECDLENPETIEPALGNAGVIVCCIGASEKEALNVSGPYRIDYKATKNLIDAACSAQVNQFVLLTSLGTKKFGFPAAALNLFWGVLLWKGKAEQALIESGLSYTIVRPGGMERPTDAYKETHNLVLAEADTLFGGQVSNLQVAELIAGIVENPEISKNKILEVVAETSAPLRPIDELLEEIPGNREGQKKPDLRSTEEARPKVDVAAQRLAKKLEEEKIAEEKRIQAEREEEERRKKAALRTKYENEILAAKEKEEEARREADTALAEKEELERKAAEIGAKAEAAALAARQAKALEAAVLSAARKGQVLTEQKKKEILASVSLETRPQLKTPEKPKVSSKKTPAFSFLGKFAPPSQTAEVPIEPSSKVTQDAPVKAKAEIEEEERLKVEAQEKRKAEEAKKQAETEARILAEQEAAKAEEERLKVEAQEKRKAEEAKKQAEIEARVLAEQEAEEAKKQAETEARILAEQEAARVKEERLKVEAQEKRRAEEAKKQAEIEARVLAEQAAAKAAEAKRKEEELANKKAEIEARILAEKEAADAAEAKQKEEDLAAAEVKAEAERLAKEKAEQKEEEAATAAEAERLAKEQAVNDKSAVATTPEPKKGVRWFWQPAEPELVEPEPTAPATSASATVSDEVTLLLENGSTELPPSQTPLSPYTRFPDLKPPSSAVPSPLIVEESQPPTASKSDPQTDAATKKESKIEADLQADLGKKVTGTRVILENVKAEEDQEVAPEVPNKDSEEDSEARKLLVLETAAREREALEKAKAATAFFWPWQNPKSAPQPVEPQVPSIGVSPEASPSIAPAEQEEVQESQILPPSSRPLSPYPMYEDLKPPTSPIPQTPASSLSIKKEVQEESSTTTKEEKVNVLTAPVSQGGNSGIQPEDTLEAVATKSEAQEVETDTGFLWPWQIPKTTVESAPIEEATVAAETVEAPAVSTAQGPNDLGSKELPPSRTPLSPYTRFPDLKPPCSPIPSPPTSLLEPPPTSLSAEPSVNGAVTGEPEGAEERVLEPAVNSGFRWPWQ